MDQDKLQTAMQGYMNKYKELEAAKLELQSQRDQIIKQLTNVEQNMIYIQGAVRALQELSPQTAEEIAGEE